MVFQDPLSSLDPRQSVESLLFEGMKAHGIAKNAKEARPRLVELLNAVGLPEAALAKYPHEFSGGQRQRIGIARALSVNPKLIVADEPVSALDVSVQAQVINLLEDLQEEFGLTYLVVAHDLAVVRHISDRIGVMYLGALVEEAEADDLYADSAAPLHAGPHVRRAGAGPGRRGPPRADPAHRRPALAVEPAHGVPVPHPVPVAPGDQVRHRAPRAAGPRDPGRQPQPPRRLPLDRADRSRARSRRTRSAPQVTDLSDLARRRRVPHGSGIDLRGPLRRWPQHPARPVPHVGTGLAGAWAALPAGSRMPFAHVRG